MDDTISKHEAPPPPLPTKPQYKPAFYAKVMLGLAMLTNATAQIIGEEFGPRTAGALMASIVFMPAMLLVIALAIWRLSGRNSLPADLALAIFSAFYFLSSLGLLGQKMLMP